MRRNKNKEKQRLYQKEYHKTDRYKKYQEEYRKWMPQEQKEKYKKRVCYTNI